MSGVAPEIELRFREVEAGCDKRTRTLLDPTKKLSVVNKEELGEQSHRIATLERDCPARHERSNGIGNKALELAEDDHETLTQLIGGNAGPGIIQQLRDDVAELTKTVAALATQVAAHTPPAGIKPALLKHGATGAAMGGTGGVIYIFAVLVRHFIGG